MALPVGSGLGFGSSEANLGKYRRRVYGGGMLLGYRFRLGGLGGGYRIISSKLSKGVPGRVEFERTLEKPVDV